MYSTDAAAKDYPAVRQAFFIDQVTMAIVVVVLLNSVADVDIGRAGNAHGIAPFISAHDRSTRDRPDGQIGGMLRFWATRGKKHRNIGRPICGIEGLQVSLLKILDDRHPAPKLYMARISDGR